MRQFGVDTIEKLNNISTKDTYPDLTFLLDIPVEIGLARRFQTEKMDRLDMETKDFHQKVRNAYLEVAKKNDHHRWAVIDASKSIDKIAENIWNIVEKKLKQ